MYASVFISVVLAFFSNGLQSVKDTTLPDYLILPASQIKGKFLYYNDTLDAVFFYNIKTKDTDIVAFSEIKAFYYNTLPAQDYDTLFVTFGKIFLRGKIIFKSPKYLVFWDSQKASLIKVKPPDFLNHQDIDKSLLYNGFVYLTTSFYGLMMSLSLYFSRDLYNSLLFLFLMLTSLWAFFFIKSKIKPQ